MLSPSVVLYFLPCTNWQWLMKDLLMSKVRSQTQQVVLSLFRMSVLDGATNFRLRIRTWTLCRMPGGIRSPWPFFIGVIHAQVLIIQALILQELDMFFRLLNSFLCVAKSFIFFDHSSFTLTPDRC